MIAYNCCLVEETRASATSSSSPPLRERLVRFEAGLQNPSPESLRARLSVAGLRSGVQDPVEKGMSIAPAKLRMWDTDLLDLPSAAA